MFDNDIFLFKHDENLDKFREKVLKTIPGSLQPWLYPTAEPTSLIRKSKTQRYGRSERQDQKSEYSGQKSFPTVPAKLTEHIGKLL
jgi:hypothetical protein